MILLHSAALIVSSFVSVQSTCNGGGIKTLTDFHMLYYVFTAKDTEEWVIPNYSQTSIGILVMIYLVSDFRMRPS